jgi:hypothetical protein
LAHSQPLSGYRDELMNVRFSPALSPGGRAEIHPYRRSGSRSRHREAVRLHPTQLSHQAAHSSDPGSGHSKGWAVDGYCFGVIISSR